MIHNTKVGLVVVGGAVLIAAVFISTTQRKAQLAPAQTIQQATSTPKQTLSGTYRCWSFNVAGSGAGSCRTQPPLILQADGSYTFSSEKGTYQIQDGKIVLSASTIRGPGMLLEENMQIRFEYDYNGKHYTTTYLRQAE